MNRKTLKMLIVVNLVLLVGLAVTGYRPQPAAAQLGGRGDYLIVSGEVVGLRKDRHAVFVLDVSNQKLAAFTFDSRTDKIEVIGTRLINDDLSRGGSR